MSLDKKAVEQAKKMGASSSEADQGKVREKLDSMRRGPIGKIWDKVVMLYQAFVSPSTPTTLKASLIGCLIYLVTPIDIIPDVLVGVGLLDDVSVILWGCSLLEKCKKTKVGKSVDKAIDMTVGAVAGVATGAVVGGVAGAAVGKTVSEHDGVEGALKAGKEAVMEKVRPLVVSLAEHMCSSSMHKSLEHSLGNFVLFLFSLFLLVVPVFGTMASAIVSSLLLCVSLALTIWRSIRSLRKTWPILKRIVKERDIDKGLSWYARLRLREAVVGISPSFPVSWLDSVPMEEIVHQVKQWVLKDVVKFVLFLGGIAFSLFLVRAGLRQASIDLSYGEILFYPFKLASEML